LVSRVFSWLQVDDKVLDKDFTLPIGKAKVRRLPLVAHILMDAYECTVMPVLVLLRRFLRPGMGSNPIVRASAKPRALLRLDQ